MRQGIEAETVNDRVLYLLRTIESGGGDRNRKKRHEAELTRMKEARREHVIVPVTSVFHLNSLIKIDGGPYGSQDCRGVAGRLSRTWD